MAKEKKKKKEKKRGASSHLGRKLLSYKAKQMKKAIKEVRSKKKTIKEAADDNNVPPSTLGHRLKARGHLGARVDTLGGARTPKVLSKGKQYFSNFTIQIFFPLCSF